MANHQSALKRQRQNVKRNARNTAAKSAVRTAVKGARAAAEAGNSPEAQKALQDAKAALARAGTKNVFHKRTVSRRISRLALLQNKLAAAKAEPAAADAPKAKKAAKPAKGGTSKKK